MPENPVILQKEYVFKEISLNDILPSSVLMLALEDIGES